MHNSRVLIVGAGIAGTTLAYWLARRGFSPTVVERAETIRTGGQAIDLHGKALHVVTQMGLLERVRAAETGIQGMDLVDATGKALARTTAFTLTGGPMDSDDIELMRSDLVNILLAESRPGVEYIFGDRMVDLADTGSGVSVTFGSDTVREFDLVLGADGLRSTTRRLAFDPGSYRVHRLGRYIAIGTIPNFLGYDRWETFYSGGPDRRLCYFSGRSATRVMFTKNAPGLDIEHSDEDDLRQLLRRDFTGDGWQTPRLLAEITGTQDFYFDDLRQVYMDRWHRGRVALVGDASHCASPASGLGTSMAIVGAYVLAGELEAAQGDYSNAFPRYEQRMRPFVAACQTRARAGGNLYISPAKFWLQRQQIRLSNVSVIRKAMAHKAAGDKARIADSIEVPAY
ncbi:FAD-dependent oxidoreductase [Nocardia colli]|uniref:FAD-dependent oxidoreductase n=1 Tax=Nocardia colli TaxID=2545717 RepID=UPI0035D63E87